MPVGQTKPEKAGSCCRKAQSLERDQKSADLTGEPDHEQVRCSVLPPLVAAMIHTVLHSRLIFTIAAFLSLAQVAMLHSTDLNPANIAPNKGALFYGVYENNKVAGLVRGIGDIDGDGFDDIIIGSKYAGILPNSGVYYVMLGQASPYGGLDGINVQDANLPYSAGFMIIGAYEDDGWGGVASGLGDINGDNLSDFIICSDMAKMSAPEAAVGLCYVILGQSTVQVSAPIYLTNFEAGTGSDPWLFKIIGTTFGEMTGHSASSAGDVNGDGFDDIIIGVQQVSPNGAAVVIFGHHHSQPFPDIELSSFLSGPNGFWILGEIAGGLFGFMVSTAGDFNGDGYDDVIVGAPLADPLNRVYAGVVYVIFGHSNATEFVDFEVINMDVFPPSGSRSGFRIYGHLTDESIGQALSGGGDVNGDGIGDVLIGSYVSSSPGLGRSDNGAVYVLFGHAATAPFPDIDLVDFLSGPSAGVVIHGAAMNDHFGLLVSMAGDVNGDGIDDILVGAPQGDQVGGLQDVGMVYVIYGRRTSFPFSTDIDMLTFTTGPGRGIVIAGESQGDRCGISVSSAGDFNNDGVGDLIFGVNGASYLAQLHAGKAYVLYGTAPKVPVFRTAPVYKTIDVSAPLPVSTGFRVIGQNPGDQSGTSVSSTGDFNGDGIDDYIIGAQFASRGATGMGVAYVLFGTDSTYSVTNIDLQNVSNGTFGFRIIGKLAYDHLGHSVSAAGDVNGDGYADILVGAFRADPYGNTDAGAVFVLFGHSDATPFDDIYTSQSLAPAQGYMIYGEESSDSSGCSVASAGDVNGDGIGDIIIGANEADSDTVVTNVGKAYVIFGKLDVGFMAVTDLDLSDLVYGEAFRIIGVAQGDQCGYSVRGAGDFNGDGYADLIVGCLHADPGTIVGAGTAYVLFANREAGYPDIFLGSFSSSAETGFKIIGALASNYAGAAVSSAGDVNGDGFADVLVSAPGTDPFSRSRAGTVFVIFGHNSPSLSDVLLSFDDFASTPGFQIYGAYPLDYILAVSSAGDGKCQYTLQHISCLGGC